jgi:hypothetical protein
MVHRVVDDRNGVGTIAIEVNHRIPRGGLVVQTRCRVALETRKQFARLTDRVCGKELTKRRSVPVFRRPFH